MGYEVISVRPLGLLVRVPPLLLTYSIMDNKDNSKNRPCPICNKMMWVVGKTKNNKKITSCGHIFSFKKTKFQKILDKKYVKTPWGLELK
jgi:hypothetical protein